MLTKEQSFAKLDEIVKTINEYCKGPVLGHFLTPAFLDTGVFSSDIHIDDGVCVRTDEIDANIILLRAIEAHDRIIVLVQGNRQKLEDMQKELS